MIEYQFKEEKDFAIHYSMLLNRPIVLAILERGFVESKSEAEELSRFFWDMVDKTIEQEKQGIKLEIDNGKFWTEKLLQTFSGHLEATGFLDVWEGEVDNQ